jgi:hypothetical protein
MALVRRLAVTLVSLVALAACVTVAAGSLGPTGRARAATVRPLAAGVRAHPMPPLQPALRRVIAQLQHPGPVLRPRTITPNIELPRGGTCYVAGNGCSIHPCVEFAGRGGEPARPVAQPAVAMLYSPVVVPAAGRVSRLRGQCRSVSGPTVSLRVSGVRVAPSASP